MFFSGAIIVIAFIFASCATTPESDSGPTVVVEAPDVSIISPESSPNVSDMLSVDYDVTTPDDTVIKNLSVIIKDESGNVVFTERREAEDSGVYIEEPIAVELPEKIFWYGRGNSGEFVPEGTYFLTVEAADNLDQTAKSDPVTIMVDNTPPEVGVDISEKIFSPNDDGKNDTLAISQKGSREESWMGTIQNSEGEVVRRWRWNATKPQPLKWDGTNEIGEVVDDGTYSYTLKGTDRAGNNNSATVQGIILSTKTHSVTMSPNFTAFSPNNDGSKDTLDFSVNAPVERTIDTWTFSLLNAQKETVTQLSGKKSLPETITFPAEGAKIPAEGEYRAKLEVVYPGGEQIETTTSPIHVDVTEPQVTLEKSAEGFSPNGDGMDETITFTQNTENAEEWTAYVIPADAAELSGAELSDQAVTIHSWEGMAPESFKWNGQIAREGELPSGRYVYALIGSDSAGNTAAAATEPFILDINSPSAGLTAEPLPFTPDGNGENDVLSLKVEAQDETSQIAEWSIQILDSKGNVFTDFSGKGAPKSEITWNGRASNDELVQSAEDYTAKLAVTDQFGNSSEAEAAISVGILVMKESGIAGSDVRIRVPNIHFVPYKADYKNLEDQELVEENMQVLDRVAEILKEYKGYSIQVEGHAVHMKTDDPEAKRQEQEEILIPLSRARAEAVKNALVERGVAEERMTVKGLGGSEPIVPHEDYQNHWKNRRVEFELKKNE
ncbi:MAG: gliding motility-associated C-terminal domain-containing protein [Spirochaetales bacterium]|nr:gliding motility-associated C-terminal domain-containing protein [Spirochaetales bacterium]MCF7938941.1 gliding motility-associated C-terminal domain-containing protein [Spirochaetales bacterium]